MKCIITGHTGQFGKHLTAYFENRSWEVIGISRTTGYDLNNIDHVHQVIELAHTCDLFINSASIITAQELFLKNLHSVVKMITIGTSATNFTDITKDEYSLQKKQIEDLFHQLSVLTESKDMLLLKISALENSIVSDYHVSYDNVVTIIDFWMNNPIVNVIDTQFKLTDFTKKKLKDLHGLDL